MVKLLLAIKHRCPWIWDSFEWLNGQLFRLRSRKVRELSALIDNAEVPSGYAFSPVKKEDLSPLSGFLLRQSPESTRYFFPHYFDEDTLARLYRNPSFLMMKAIDVASGDIVGYFFLRCFIVRVSVAGLLVDENHRGRGLGTCMWSCCMALAAHLRHRMFATISSANAASLRSCEKGTGMHVRKKLRDNYLLVECKQKHI